MNSKEIYSITISSKVNMPTSRTYFEKKFRLYNFQWKDIDTLPRKVTINAYVRSFHSKILNNILYLNKKLHTFGLSNTQLCSFCKMEEETISHLFYYSIHIQDTWNQVEIYFTDCFHFSQLTPQTAIFGFHNIIMILCTFKITYYFYSNYIYTISENKDFYLLQFSKCS